MSFFSPFQKAKAIKAAASSGLESSAGIVFDSLPDRLRAALDEAATCERYILPEQERLVRLLNDAKSDIERGAREYQIEYTEMYLKRAASLARERIEHFKTLNSQTAIEAEKEKIKADKIHWFKFYAWGYDPRARTPLAVVPFELLPTQKGLVGWLDEQVFDRRGSGLIEKSRDEGATEVMTRWGLHNWLFVNGFSMLLSTRKEDEVDSKKNQNTLFERIRYQIRLLPKWQLPDGFNPDKNMLSAMMLANPANQNTLIGEAPVENMGRGGRVTCAMLDEFAFWQFAGYPQFRSLSQTTDSILMPSSVAGRLNQYADIAHDGITPKFVMDWHDNPFKDIRWYNSLPYGYISPKMSRTTIAQEVDRNYDAAQPGKVWQCPEPHVFITQSEFLKPFERARVGHKFFDEKGAFKIPDDWRVIRTSDYGKSEGHDWGYLLGAQPSASYPLNDTHFIFVARLLEPTGLLTAEAVKLWREWERNFGLRDVQDNWLHKPAASYNSHEQKELRKVLSGTYGEHWIAWDTDYQTGIETVEDWWTPIDLLEQNPFRPELYGRCRLVFVAPDSEYSLAYNEDNAVYFVTISQTEEGFNQARKEISAYHYPMSELGKAKKDMRPEKVFDNIVDPIRGYAVNWNRKPLPMSPAEQREAALPAHLQQNNIAQVETVNPEYAERLVQSRVIEFGRMDRQDNQRRAQMAKYRPSIPKIR